MFPQRESKPRHKQSQRNGWRIIQRMATALLALSLPTTTLAYPQAESQSFAVVSSIELLSEVYRELAAGYVEPLDTALLMKTGIRGMLRSLDPYTTLLERDDADELADITRGRYVGIGISLATLEKKLYVTAVNEESPAAAAGIRTGDAILAINEAKVANIAVDSLRTLLHGTNGSPITFQLERRGSAPRTTTVQRQSVPLKSVPYYELHNNIGYIALDGFTTRSPHEVRSAWQSLQQQATANKQPLRGLIVDLRDNSGGLLDAALEITSLFVPNGSEVVSIKGRSTHSHSTLKTTTEPLDATLPVALLINGDTASAAEIVAGALQDVDRAIILGERSYGKGLVQSVKKLSYGNTLKFTTAKYYTPSGRLIQKELKKESSPHSTNADSKQALASAVPDTTQRFYTRNHRIVYGGGGIMPDVEIKEPASPYVTALRKRGMIFLFANEWYATHSDDAPASSALLPSQTELLAHFEKFLQQKEFRYTSNAAKRLEELKSAMKESGRENPEALRTMEREVELADTEERNREAKQVAVALESAILRHASEHLARQAELRHDALVLQAEELLIYPARYRAMLKASSTRK
uniref:C-terminal processing peptidase-3, Serine peptidase, MEROPS family S41A n=1 Tax=Chlorobium chlorochromatii (strain CaD3) TaxID=340177 RepID=Q3AP36_CHLCH